MAILGKAKLQELLDLTCRLQAAEFYQDCGSVWACDYCGLVRPDSLTHCWDGWQGCGAGRSGVEEVELVPEWSDGPPPELRISDHKWVLPEYDWRKDIGGPYFESLVRTLAAANGTDCTFASEMLSITLDRQSVPTLDCLGISAGLVRKDVERKMGNGWTRHKAFCWAVAIRIELMRSWPLE